MYIQERENNVKVNDDDDWRFTFLPEDFSSCTYVWYIHTFTYTKRINNLSSPPVFLYVSFYFPST